LGSIYSKPLSICMRT